MEKEKPELFELPGTEEDFKKGVNIVPADDVLNAIVEGQDIHIECYIIEGNLDIGKNPGGLLSFDR